MYEDISIKVFMDAWFKNSRDVLSEEDFKAVYSEYIDTANLYEMEQFEKVSYLNYVNNRINSIRLAVDLQKRFIKEFNYPFEENLPFFKKYGYKLYYNGSLPIFLEELEKIESKEKKYISIAENTAKSIIDLNKAKQDKTYTIKETRLSFLTMVNALGKIGYKIDKETTTVEELALIIKHQSEEANRSNNR